MPVYFPHYVFGYLCFILCLGMRLISNAEMGCHVQKNKMYGGPMINSTKKLATALSLSAF